MTAANQVTDLKNRHATLEKTIQDEIARPHPDQDIVVSLKKEKLRIKDELVELGAE
ncbi:MAG: YdcH family protein [Proteobacteria bacterium]|nr:YdcH family protein [Pseudomonadota bacterium]MDA1324398.1 YdcH family protein [Pseudomonadota bacterium]